MASSRAATANVEDMTGNFITGKVTVERYINTGLPADGRHLKSWQFLSTPTSGQTIFQSWQENGTTPIGYGTVITGNGSGFDATTATPSMKQYNTAGNSWMGITNTVSPINDPKGYLLFVRGDRTVTAYNQDAVPTILRTKGTLYQPSTPPPVVSVQAARLASIGNPYASAIDLVYMKNNGLLVNLNNDVTVWDPLLAGTYLLGGYQTLSAANNYEPTAGSTATAYYPAGVSSPFIQSGQAFFVRSSGAVGSVTFNEACKESSNRLVNRVPPVTRERRFFRATLFTRDNVIADGNAVVFDPAFDNRINADDSYKLPNSGENFGLIRNGQKLAVEARRSPGKTDTIFYTLANLRKQPYELRFAPKNMRTVGLKAYLIDRYLHSSTELSLFDSSFVTILINNDPLSYAAHRFFVVFKKHDTIATGQVPGATEHLKNTDSKPKDFKQQIQFIGVYPNPVENKTLQLHFINEAAGTYYLLLTNSLGQSVYSGSIKVNNASCFRSIYIGHGVSSGFYLLNVAPVKGKKTVIRILVK